MTMTIGIDISRDWLDIGRFPEAANCAPGARFTNDASGHAALIAWLETLSAPVRVIFEGKPDQETIRGIVSPVNGAYHRAPSQALEQAARPFRKVNPRQARRFAQATGQLARTDRIDAGMLARMGHVLELEPRRPQGEKQFDLSALSTARQALVKGRNALPARRPIASHALVQRRLDRRREAIEADIAGIDAALAALVRADEGLRERAVILVPIPGLIPGLGATSATTILAEMPELGTMGGKQAAAMAGLAPITRGSGKWQGRAFIGGGRANPRRALYMPALVATRHNPGLGATYDRLVAAGKPKKLALVAVMRKLIILANALLREGRNWTSNTA